MSLRIDLPAHFSFDQCLTFLARSDREVLHKVQDRTLIKPWAADERTALLEISQHNNHLRVRDLRKDEALPSSVEGFVREIFDLERDLSPFYNQLQQDRAIAELLDRYSGLRLIRIPSLFETLAWTIIGQQINLGFAYSMKSRLVEATGKFIDHQGERYHFFPEPEAVLQLKPEDLKAMQFSRQKSDYLLNLAQVMAEKSLTKAELLALEEPAQQHKRLLQIRGIGPWSADYTLLKCLGVSSAMPLTDAGLHNALRQIHQLKEKPSLEEIQKFARKWQGWEGYVTFFLWRSLIL